MPSEFGFDQRTGEEYREKKAEEAAQEIQKGSDWTASIGTLDAIIRPILEDLHQHRPDVFGRESGPATFICQPSEGGRAWSISSGKPVFHRHVEIRFEYPYSQRNELLVVVPEHHLLGSDLKQLVDVLALKTARRVVVRTHRISSTGHDLGLSAVHLTSDPDKQQEALKQYAYQGIARPESSEAAVWLVFERMDILARLRKLRSERFPYASRVREAYGVNGVAIKGYGFALRAGANDVLRKQYDWYDAPGLFQFFVTARGDSSTGMYKSIVGGCNFLATPHGWPEYPFQYRAQGAFGAVGLSEDTTISIVPKNQYGLGPNDIVDYQASLVFDAEFIEQAVKAIERKFSDGQETLRKEFSVDVRQNEIEARTEPEEFTLLHVRFGKDTRGPRRWWRRRT